MKLSAKLICYHLQKSFSMHTSRLDTFPTLSCPSRLEKNTSLQDGRVYLITDPDFQLTFHHPKKYSVPDDWKNLSELRINSAKHVYHP